MFASGDDKASGRIDRIDRLARLIGTKGYAMTTEASTACTLFDIRIDGTIAEISSSQTIRKRRAESASIRYW